MVSILLLLDLELQDVGSSEQMSPCDSKVDLCRATMPSRGPEEARKRLRTCSPRRGSLQFPGALGSHKDCLRVVAVWPEPTPSRVWKGVVLVMSANLSIKI